MDFEVSVETPGPSASPVPATVDKAPPIPPAVAKAVKAKDFAAFEQAEYAQREEKRDPSRTRTADSSPATPAKQAASTDASSKSASEPTPAPKAAKSTAKNAEERLRETLEELGRVRRELDQARQPARETRSPASEPATAAASTETFPDLAEWLTAHPESNIRDWSEKHWEFLNNQKDSQRTNRELADAQTRSIAEQNEDLRKQAADMTAADPEWASRLDPDVSQTDRAEVVKMRGEPVTPANIISSAILDSSMAAKLSLHFSEHKDDWLRLQQVPERMRSLPPPLMARQHIEWIKREIGRIEGKLEAGSAAASSPAPKTVTSAPSPGTTLGGRPTDPSDPAKAAAERKSFTDFERVQHQRAAARRAR